MQKFSISETQVYGSYQQQEHTEYGCAGSQVTIVRWIVTHMGLDHTFKVDDERYGTEYEHTQHTGHESTQFLYNVHMEYLLVGTVPHYVT